LTDGVYGGVVGASATGVELTKTWGFNAAYEHFWNQQWKTSVYGGYAAVRYGSQANNMLCGGAGGIALGSAAPVVVGCDNNWSSWWVGSRTQWNISKDFYMGLDVLYSKLSTATNPAVLAVANSSDQDNVAVRFRVHRDFMP
jgi:hypothetical protein